MKFKEYWAKKSPKQRFCLIILSVLILIFIIFFIKGNFIDSSGSEPLFLDFGDWIDIIAVAAATIAYILLQIHNKKGGGKK